MIIKINTKSETPIYLQLRNEIVKGIGKGEFERGESLPLHLEVPVHLQASPEILHLNFF